MAEREFRVFERQVITYSWLVTAEDAAEAEGSAVDGVPDGATTERFTSETWAEAVQP